MNLFSEYWDSVLIDTFTTSLLAAILLQLLFQVTIVVEHHIVDYFKSKSGTGARVLGLLSTWIALFIFKLIILGIINFVFGDQVVFSGVLDGVVAFIVVVIAIIAAQQIIIRIYNSLA